MNQAVGVLRPFGTASLVACTSIALLGFSANSLLTRFALDTSAIDAASFMMLRLGAGALALGAITGLRAAGSAGSWTSAAALAAYAFGFTFAYIRIGASVGALLLFGSVQATMIGWGLMRGERPGRAEWLGLALSVAGLVVLTAPGLSAPDAIGSVLMIGAGAAWGIYSLRGRGGGSPLLATAGNFIRALPIALLFALPMRPDVFVSARGVLLAVISGSAASALAYIAWYTALPRLTAWRAAIVQLSVPVITAFGASLLLGEGITPRLAAAGAAIIGGVVVSMTAATRVPASSADRRDRGEESRAH
jgi:drug/metabolite transporter (DMT)-like permease